MLTFLSQGYEVYFAMFTLHFQGLYWSTQDLIRGILWACCLFEVLIVIMDVSTIFFYRLIQILLVFFHEQSQVRSLEFGLRFLSEPFLVIRIHIRVIHNIVTLNAELAASPRLFMLLSIQLSEVFRGELIGRMGLL